MVNHTNSAVIFLIVLYFVQVSAYQVFKSSRRRGGNGTLNPIEKHTDDLFKVLDELPENELFLSMSCGIMEQEMPDFRTPERRISEVKCLEQLWKTRFYDQLLLKKVRCKTGVEGAYVTFAIYKGKEVSSSKFPHTGAIGWKSVSGAWIFLCSGALISERFMITAAHCSISSNENVSDPTPKIVRLGTKNILDSSEFGKIPMDINIKSFIVHENYRPPSKYYDIAVIELEYSIPFNVFSRPSCIWSIGHEELFGRAHVTGWGVVESDNPNFNPIFEISDVDLINRKVCRENLEEKINTSIGYFNAHQICANYVNNDTCKGDSGGPLMMPIRNPGYSDFAIHYIIGVESTSYDCDSEPNIFTRVSSFAEWIEDIVWEADSDVREYLSEKNFARIYEGI